VPRDTVTPTLLMVDDDLHFLSSASDFLKENGYSCIRAHTCRQAELVCQTQKVDLAVLDQRLPDGSGAALCERLLALQDGIKIIFMTAFPSFEVARAAVRAGAYDYLSKPFEPEALALAVSRALEVSKLERLERVGTYHRRDEARRIKIVGAEGGMKEVAAAALRAAEADAPVLITGETGTGKGLLAKCIHYDGKRRSGPFLSLNCAALPENLFEAELFGYEKGSYTGASGAREGLLETVSSGTLLLDELGELPLHLQAKLLGAMEEKKIRRLGGRVERPIDVRILAATNVDLEAAVAQGRFRRDLFFRLNVLTIDVPPLRERKQDIPDLCRHLLSEMECQGGWSNLDREELSALQAYSWPGNVRELRNVLERALLHAGSGGGLRPSAFLAASDPAPEAGKALPFLPHDDGLAPLAAIESEYIAHVLGQCHGNLARTSRTLGISLSTLKRKLGGKSERCQGNGMAACGGGGS
jgi:DNA-binding NtrC family response regulator